MLMTVVGYLPVHEARYLDLTYLDGGLNGPWRGCD